MAMAVDHASGISAPKSDPVFLHVKSGMTVIVTDTDGATYSSNNRRRNYIIFEQNDEDTLI